MRIDERRLNELMVESQDLQADALRDSKRNLADLADIREERRGDEVDPVQIEQFNEHRRSLVEGFGFSGGKLATGGLLVGGFGAALGALLATPAAADQNLDIQILQTASSLEILAVATYDAALTLDFIKNGNKVVKAFAETTRKQHDEHNKAFQAQTKVLGGKERTTPNPKYTPVVEQAKPTLKSPLDVVKLAATLERVARDTYVSDMVQFSDKKSLSIMASVQGVETQHLAILRAVQALIEGGAPELIAIPTDIAKLPAAAGSVGFPEAFPMTSMASPAAEGAVA